MQISTFKSSKHVDLLTIYVVTQLCNKSVDKYFPTGVTPQVNNRSSLVE